jgi:hypothetical protein
MTEPSKRYRPSDGRDQLNLAEYPLALLTFEQSRTTEPLVYHPRSGGTVTVTGNDRYGLPTAMDLDVLMAMMWLTKAKNGFTDRQVNFYRHELISMLRWDNNGRSYGRLVESLRRWRSVTIHFQDSWFDTSSRITCDRIFGILDDVCVYDSGPTRGPDTPVSYFRWNETFFAGCETNGLKKLDVDTYFSLELATTKRLFRFLDKRFYREPVLTFDLRELAFEHVGLSRGYKTPAKIREKLKPGLAELERIGFIKPASFYVDVHDEPRVRLERAMAESGPSTLPTAEPQPVGLVKELVDLGVSRGVAEEIVRTKTEALVRHAMAESMKKRVKKPAAYLVRVLNNNPTLPDPGPPSPPSPALRVVQPDEPDPVRAMLREIEVDPDRRREFTAAAIANADPADREAYAKFPADPAACTRLPAGQAFQRVALLAKVREDHARRLLEQAEGREGDPGARSADPPADEGEAVRKPSRRRK